MNKIATSAGVAIALALFAAPLAANAEELAPCTTEEVTVVVDYGEEVKLECAPVGGTGTDVLAQAGFEADAPSGFVQQIDTVPETVDSDAGFWAYWYAESADAEWTMAEVGSADRSPEAGSIEGWSYTSPIPADFSGRLPAVEPGEVAPVEPTASDSQSQEPESEEQGEAGVDMLPWLLVGLGVLVIAGIVLAVVVTRRTKVTKE